MRATAAVAALRDRPVLFKYCAEEVGEEKRYSESDSEACQQRVRGWSAKSERVVITH